MSGKIAMQFKKPTGFLGKIISSLMVTGNHSIYKILIEKLDIQSTDKILEIGYGPGVGIKLISRKYNLTELYGIDFSELMFKRASKRNKQFIDAHKVNLLFGDFVETDLNISNLDKIFCINVVYFWDDLQLPFGKIRSLLCDGGIFYFYMRGKDELSRLKFTDDGIFNKYSIEQIVEALTSAGFSNIEYCFDKGYYIEARK